MSYPNVKKLQFTRGLKIANVPGGRPDNLISVNGQVQHVNTMMPILQNPIDSGDESGKIRFGPDGFGVSITSDVMTTVTSSVIVDGNVNMRRSTEREIYDRYLQGLAKRFEIGEAPDPVLTFLTVSVDQHMLFNFSGSFITGTLPYPGPIPPGTASISPIFSLGSSSAQSGMGKNSFGLYPYGLQINADQVFTVRFTASLNLSGTTTDNHFEMGMIRKIPTNPLPYFFRLLDFRASGTVAHTSTGSVIFSSLGTVPIKAIISGSFDVPYDQGNSSSPYFNSLNFGYNGSDINASGSSVGFFIYATSDTFGSLTGTLSMSADVVAHSTTTTITTSTASYGQQLATSPSWTQKNIGKSHAFIISDLSSSAHRSNNLNAFNSGTEPLETTAVPASASMFYEKNSRFVTIVKKLSSSDTLFAGGTNILDRQPFSLEVASRSTNVAVSGVYINRSQWNPATIEFNVPEYGRIRDIKVWLEFVHDVRGGTGVIGTSSAYPQQGLQNLKIALRSPNVSFRCAHPLWNDPNTFGNGFYRELNLSGSSNQFGNRYHKIPEILSSSYLLWDGHAIDSSSYTPIFTTGTVNNGFFLYPNTGTIQEVFAEWDTDIDMRTIFTDSSRIPNPRHIEPLFSFPYGFHGPGPASIEILSGNAPNTVVKTFDPSYPFTSSVHGNNVPWIYDPRLSSSLSTGAHNFTASLGGMSPPPGWLTGPASTFADGEFPTTGSQIGPSTILPVYPMLDDISVEEYEMNPIFFHYVGLEWDTLDNSLAPSYSGSGPYLTNAIVSESLMRKKLKGFRPGLRGTEINGKWKLMIGMGDSFTPTGGYLGDSRAGLWFRQARLEFLVDQKQGVTGPNPGKLQRFKKTGNVPTSQKVAVVQGFSTWDIKLSNVVRNTKQEYGRTIGITSNTASYDYAVFTRITGALMDTLSENSSSIDFFLSNSFGTPYIPISSGTTSGISVMTPAEIDASKRMFVDVIRPNRIVHPAQNLKSTLSRTKYFNKTDTQISELISSRDLSSGSI